MSFHCLSPLHYACLSSLSSVSIPKHVGDALSHPGWRQAMLEEMCALQSSGTRDFTPLPLGKTVVGCHWIFAVKVGLDGQVDRLKARLVAKGYIHRSMVLTNHSVFYCHLNKWNIYLIV